MSVIEQCIGVQREDTQPLEGQEEEEEEEEEGCLWNQEALYSTRAMRLALTTADNY